jgi:hypothetical protein
LRTDAEAAAPLRRREEGGLGTVYSDYEPCEVCGSEVRLRAPRKDRSNEPDGPVDERVCTNDACGTNTRESSEGPRP